MHPRRNRIATGAVESARTDVGSSARNQRGTTMESLQHRKNVTFIAGLAGLVVALAMVAIAASPSYAKPPDLNGPARAVEGSVADLRSPDQQAPGPQATSSDLRAPDQQSPGSSTKHVVASGSASTMDYVALDKAIRAQDAANAKVASPKVLPGPPTWPQHPASLPVSHTGSPDSGGIEMWSAAAGAGAMLMIVLAGLTAYVTTTRRRGGAIPSPTTVAAGH
jgi:hypothetical protein